VDAISGTALGRLTFALNRSSEAMLITSLTSSIAFFCTAISPIPAVYSFGITMGFMVLANFALVITWFPAAVIVHERYGTSLTALCRLSAGSLTAL
jgi:predicted RND superfamily exporter protein